MDITYNGAHSITFYNYRDADMTVQPPTIDHYNTWSTWHLIPAQAPYVKPYEPKVTIVDIPDSEAGIDLSEAVAGGIPAARRNGEWEFIMDTERAGMTAWDLYYRIRSAIHGKWLLVVFADLWLWNTPDRYRLYSGRITVTDFEVGEQYATIKIGYNLGSINTAWLASKGEIIKEAISNDWKPITFNEDGTMEVQSFEPVITTDQFIISYETAHDGMYEIEVDDDGTLIAEEPISGEDIPEEYEIEIPDEPEWDPTATFMVKYVNDDGTVLPNGTFSNILVGTVVNPSTQYTGTTPQSQYESDAAFTGWSEEDGLTVYGDVTIRAVYSYSNVYKTLDYYNDDGTFLATEQVLYGGDGVRASSLVMTSYYSGGAVFVGWNKPYTNVTEDRRLFAEYRYNTAMSHVVTYVNDGVISGQDVDAIGEMELEKAYVPDGGIAVYKGEAPDSLYAPGETTFTGWRSDLSGAYLDNVRMSFKAKAQYNYDSMNFYITTYNDSYQEMFWKTITGVVDPGVLLSVLPLNAAYSIGSSYYTFESYPGGEYVQCPNEQTALYSSINGNGFTVAQFICPQLTVDNSELTGNNNPYSVIAKYRRYYALYTYNHGRVIDDSWETIIENINDSSYTTKYKVGDLKQIDVNVPIGWRSTTDYDGFVTKSIMMEIVSIDGGDVNGITWVSREAIPAPDVREVNVTNGVLAYTSSSIATYLNSTTGCSLYTRGFPDSVKNAMKQTYHNLSNVRTTNQQTYERDSNYSTKGRVWIPSSLNMGIDPYGMTSYHTTDYGNRFATSASRKKYESTIKGRANITESTNTFFKWLLNNAELPESGTVGIGDYFEAIDVDGSLTKVSIQDNDYRIVFGFTL